MVTKLRSKLVICGSTFWPVAESGTCRQIAHDHQIEVASERESWTITAPDLVSIAGVSIGDNISAVVLSTDGRPVGSMFLSYNHSSRQWGYFKDAVRDVHRHVERPRGWLADWRLDRRLRRIGASLPQSASFASVLDELCQLEVSTAAEQFQAPS